MKAAEPFQYPPFKLLIKITKEGKNENQLNKEIEAAKNSG